MITFLSLECSLFSAFPIPPRILTCSCSRCYYAIRWWWMDKAEGNWVPEWPQGAESCQQPEPLPLWILYKQYKFLHSWSTVFRCFFVTATHPSLKYEMEWEKAWRKKHEILHFRLTMFIVFVYLLKDNIAS